MLKISLFKRKLFPVLTVGRLEKGGKIINEMGWSTQSNLTIKASYHSHVALIKWHPWKAYQLKGIFLSTDRNVCLLQNMEHISM